MRRLLLLAAALPLVLAGCLQGTSDETAAATGDDAPAVPDLAAEPETFEWSGHVIDSRIEGPTHVRPTEDVLWPVFQEGILFDVQEAPQTMQVALEWTGSGEFMIMLHSHKAHGTNEYVEHITPLDAENPKCLQVPAADLTEGVWQVMVHSRGATNVDFTLRVTMLGGAGAIVQDDRHGHWLQDGSFDIEEKEPEACTPPTPPAA